MRPYMLSSPQLARFSASTSPEGNAQHQYEYALHDLIPKDKMIRLRPENQYSLTNPHDLGFLRNILFQLKLSSEDTVKEVEGTFDFWEQLSREMVA